jgi:hypothetical protein
MHRKIFTPFMILLVSLLSACSMLSPQKKAEPFMPPYTVIHSSDSQVIKKPGGVWYMLPKSRFEVNLHIKRTELVKGPYAQFAGKYLGIDNVINNSTTVWQIEDISIRSTPVPDTSQLYYVSMGSMDTMPIPVSMMFHFNNIGVFSGNTPAEDSRVYETSTIQGTGGYYSSVFKYHAESNLFETIDTIVERVMLDSVSVEKTVLRKKLVEKPMEQRAKETSDLILKLREERLRILTGYQEIPFDPSTIRFMVGELERMEREYIELFTGLTIQTNHTRRFYFTPTPGDNCMPVPMIRFSAQEGVLPLEGSRGDVMYIQCCAQGVKDARNRFRMDLDSLANLHNTGFVYRNPEWAMLTIFLGSRMQKEIGFQVPQYGTSERLPWFVTKFSLDSETGALIQVRYP